MSDRPDRVVRAACSFRSPVTSAHEYGSAARAWAVLPNRLNTRAMPTDGVLMFACTFSTGSVGLVSTEPLEKAKPVMANVELMGARA